MKKILSLMMVILMVISIVPMSVFAADTGAQLQVESVSGMPGDEVQVKINLSNNPGLSSIAFSVAYDEMLTLTNVVLGNMFSNETTATPYTNPQKISCISPIADVTTNGVVATLTFKISETAADGNTAAVTVSYNEDDVFNTDLDNVALKVMNGNISVFEGIAGDINSDKVVNNKDAVILFRYIAGWSVSVDEKALDCNGDGSVNNKDAVTLFRYVAGWPNIALYYAGRSATDPTDPDVPSGCTHSLMKTNRVEPTCTEEGNIDFWYCRLCNKYFSNSVATNEITVDKTILAAKGHTPVIDPAIEPTNTTEGKTEGSHCADCGTVLKAQETIPPLTDSSKGNIVYRLFKPDETYLSSQEINNPNPNTYTIGKGLALSNDLHVPGYTFVGWFDSFADGATQIKSISASETETVTLYAHWKENVYDITYKLYQTPLEEITGENYLHYTVSKGLQDLPNPTINNYVFMGWYLDDGTEITNIPVGTTGNIVLNAYWTSKRNICKPVKEIDEPFFVEDPDAGRVYFAYELGTIENVPVSDAFWTVQSVVGLAQQHTTTQTFKTSQSQANAIAQTVSSSTVDSRTWTLNENWNETTSVNESWAEQHGLTISEAEQLTKTSSNTYAITSAKGGSKTKTKTDGTTTVEYDSRNIKESDSVTTNWEINGKLSNSTELSAGAKIPLKMADVNVGVKNTTTLELGGKYGKTSNESNEINNHVGTDTTTVDTTVDTGVSTWNNSNTASATQSASVSQSVNKAISDVITSTKGYGSSYSNGGSSSDTEGQSKTTSNSSNTTSTLTYCTEESKTVTTTYSADGKSEGSYRLVMAGTVHVFGVVGYDVASKSYFTYTYNIMDDKVHEFLDYSPDGSFTDCEYGAIPFNIPYDIADYVTGMIARTKGLQFRTNSISKTATVINYDGSETDVVIPSYISVGGVSYKVTSITSGVFAGKNIESIVLGDYIETLSDGAFKDCKALKEVRGRFKNIGNEAFSGCTSLENFKIPSDVASIGTDAFKGLSGIEVDVMNASTAIKLATDELNLESAYDENQKLIPQVKDKAIEITQNYINSVTNSGAESITLNLSDLISNKNINMNVPEIDAFILEGGSEVFEDFQLVSKAQKTTLNNITLIDCKKTPLDISSSELALDAVSINSYGYALLLKGNDTVLNLTRDSAITSENGKAVVCRNVSIDSKVLDDVVGSIGISGNVYVCGEISGRAYADITNGKIIPISEEEFAKFIKGSYTLSFDPNGGSVSETSREVFCGSSIGTLPVPKRAYYSFAGWFTQKDGGDLVIDNQQLESFENMTLYAHWSQKAVSDWTLASNVPSDAEIVNTKWTYTLRSYTTSSSSSLSGWTKYDTTTNYGAWSGWSDWSLSNPGSSDVKEVQSQYVYGYYYFLCPKCGAHMHGYPVCYTWGGGCGASSMSLNSGVTKFFTNPWSSGGYDFHGTGKTAYDGLGGGRWFKWDQAGTGYRYRTRSKSYTYHYYKDESKETTAGDPTGQNNVRNVQKWVKYRAK